MKRPALLLATLLALLVAATAACTRRSSTTTTEPTTTTPERIYDLDTLGLPGRQVDPLMQNLFPPLPGYTYADLPDEEADARESIEKNPDSKKTLSGVRIMSVYENGLKVGGVVAYRFKDDVSEKKILEFIDGQLQAAADRPSIVALGSKTGLQFRTEVDGKMMGNIVVPVGKAVVLIVTQDPAAAQRLGTAFVDQLGG